MLINSCEADSDKMETEPHAIEKDIQEFVSSRIGEKVKLDLGSEGKVSIKPICPHGSTVLGIFWLWVLQHPNNYPPQHYPYRRLYRAASRYKVMLKVDTITITVCLHLVKMLSRELKATGQMSISGVVALDWFVTRFSGLMKAYVLPAKGGQEMKDPFDAEQKRLIKTVKSHILKNYMEDWPDIVVDKDMNILEARKILKEIQEKACIDAGNMEKPLPVGPLLGEKSSEAYYIDNMLSSLALQDQLSKLKEGIMIDGATLYAVWTSLLDRWFSDSDTKVYIVTPVLDTPCLQRLCHIFLNNRLSGSLVMLATPLKSQCGHLADVRHEAMYSLPTKDQLSVEYNIYNSMVFPATEFQAKFIAGVCHGSVEVLLTSANCESKHFQAEHSSMAIFQTMSADEFDRRLLAPIIASVD